MPFEISEQEIREAHTHNHHGVPFDAILPPVSEFKAPKDEGGARIRYSFKVTVKRTGLLNPNLSQTFDIKYLPPRPVVSPEPPSFIEVVKGDRNLSLVFSLPSPAILHVSNPLPLQLLFKTDPARDPKTLPLILRSLKIAIRETTTILLPRSNDAWAKTHPLLNVSDLKIPIEVNKNAQALPNELWKDILVPDVRRRSAP